MMQKLILVGEEGEVVYIMAALAVASCHLKVVDFQLKTVTLLSEVDGGVAEPLLSAVEKVTVRGALLRRAPFN
jgi:hypothetical protein